MTLFFKPQATTTAFLTYTVPSILTLGCCIREGPHTDTAFTKLYLLVQRRTSDFQKIGYSRMFIKKVISLKSTVNKSLDNFLNYKIDRPRSI